MIGEETRTVSVEILEKAFKHMATAVALTQLYEENFKFVSKYVHATSRGHEAIQIATGMQLLPVDFAFPYYRDDSFLLAIGMQPYELMLQLMAKRDDPFSGGRTYYSHPSLRRDHQVKIPHQSSATGMQAIPATGAAMGMRYLEIHSEEAANTEMKPLVLCSLGDAAVTEGEVAEAFQMAALKQFPIIYLIQDNEWDISAHAREIRAMNAAEYAKGFPGIEVRSVDGSDFAACYEVMKDVINTVRSERRPFLVHATVPLLNHHTSGVRKEWYRDDLEAHQQNDPYPIMKDLCLEQGIWQVTLDNWEQEVKELVRADFDKARNAADPVPEDLFTHDFAPTPITEEIGAHATG